MDKIIEQMRVGRSTSAKSLGGAIKGKVMDGKGVELSCLGVDAVNIAAKGVAIGTRYLKEAGKDLTCHITMEDEIIDDRIKTIIRFQLNV